MAWSSPALTVGNVTTHEFDEAAARRMADGGDAQAMFDLGVHLEAEAQRLMREARKWFDRGTSAGSLDAALAKVRLTVADGGYSSVQALLIDTRRRHPDLPADRFVTVAPDVLGGGLALDSDGWHDEGDAIFTIFAWNLREAAGAVARVARRLMDVDEFGVEKPQEQREREWQPGVDEPYTPNFLFEVKWNMYAVRVHLDTKGGMTAAMGCTMVGILVDALVADGIPAHIAGDCPDIPAGWRVYEPDDD
jgi:hypothetical protein